MRTLKIDNLSESKIILLFLKRQIYEAYFSKDYLSAKKWITFLDKPRKTS